MLARADVAVARAHEEGIHIGENNDQTAAGLTFALIRNNNSHLVLRKENGAAIFCGPISFTCAGLAGATAAIQQPHQAEAESHQREYAGLGDH